MKHSILLAFLLCHAAFMQAQFLQMGDDINGEAGDDRFGIAVALDADGSRLVVGGTANDGNGSNSGHVRVYDWDGAAWNQVGADINGESVDDESGESVDISDDGSRIIIGAQKNDGSFPDAGHARIYEWNGSSWVQLGNDIDGLAATDQFGVSVSISGDGSRVAIGAPGNDGSFSNAGHVRVYDWNGTSWVQTGTDIEGEAPSDVSGGSVSLSTDGMRLAIGAVGNDAAGSLAGHTRIYEWNTVAWVQLGSDIDGEAAVDLSGRSVSMNIDGSRVAIGADGNDGGGLESGHARVFDWDGVSWMQVGNDIDGESSGDQSGVAVSLSDDGLRICIGAADNDGIGSNGGHVRVYDWDGLNWVQYDNDIDGEAAEDRSGKSTSLSRDGFRLAIGADGNDGTAAGAGHVRIYDLTVLLETESIKFIATSNQVGVILKWSIFNEAEKGYYIIERRTTNGELEQISKVEVNTENDKQYEFVDENLNAGNYYYFISQFNSFGVLEQTALSFVAHNTQLKIFQSGHNEFTINSSSPMSAYTVFNMWGLEMFDQQLDGQKTATVSLKDSLFANGIYIIKIENEEGLIAQQLYKASQ